MSIILSKTNSDLLKKVHDGAIASGEGYIFVAESSTKKLVELGLLQVNPDLKNEKGALATALTAEGVAFLTSNISEEPAGKVTIEPAVIATKPTFAIEEGFPIPAVRRLNTAKKYPFAELEVNQCFHVPAKNPEEDIHGKATARQLGSTVSGATNNSKADKKDKTCKPTKKFIVRAVGAEDPKGPGARVFRVELVD